MGYKVKFNGRQNGHIRERLRKGAAVMGHVWGIGKREQEIWKGLGEKVMAIRQIGLVGG